MNSVLRWVLPFCLSALINECSAARILAVFPLVSASHSAVLHTITVELAKRGHELVVFDGYSAGREIENLTNYREYLLKENAMPSGQLRQLLTDDVNILQLLMNLPEAAETLMNRTLSNEQMARLISPSAKETFDLIMIEWISWDSLNALGYRFNAPVIGIITVPITIFGFSQGLPLSSIDIPPYMTGQIGEKTFLDRLKGFVADVVIAAFRHYSLYRQQRLVEKFFGQDYPHVYDMMRNVSMIFTDQDYVMPYPTIGAPNIVNIGGIHVSKETDQVLPSEVKDFLDKSENGFVYFSLGSTLPGSYMPDEMRRIFVEAFATIPYRVIWKWEEDQLPGKPDNVLISKWLPQRAILAHPRIKAFIYQGGLQSTEEAIAAGVPLIALPIFGDQEQNVNKMVHIGGAVKLNIRSFTKSDLQEAILEVAENVKYKEGIIQFRDLLNDRPYDPVNHTMWWIEYVIRYRGAHHLRLVRSSLLWYQAQNLDVITLCIVILLVLTLITYKGVKLIVRCCCCRPNQSLQKIKQS